MTFDKTVLEGIQQIIDKRVHMIKNTALKYFGNCAQKANGLNLDHSLNDPKGCILRVIECQCRHA